MELPENISINKYTIKLIEEKQSLYRPIYAFIPVELEILKTYIKTYLKIGLIQISKFLAGVFILINKKLDDNFYLCIDY